MLIYSQLSRRNTAKKSGTSFVTVRPDKIKACESILFTECIPEVKIKKQ